MTPFVCPFDSLVCPFDSLVCPFDSIVYPFVIGGVLLCMASLLCLAKLCYLFNEWTQIIGERELCVRSRSDETRRRCHVQHHVTGERYPCVGRLVALRGHDGVELWRLRVFGTPV